MAEWSESYPKFAESLSPAYRELPREQLEQVVEGVFGPGTTLEMAEGFFDGIGQALSGVGRTVANIASQAAPVLAKAAPGALSGATAGAALGPLGALGGGLVGGLSSAFGSSGGGPSPGVPGASKSAGALPTAPGPASLPALFGAGAGSTGAIAQLLSALGSPTVPPALTSMIMGPAGNRTVATPTGKQVPVGAILNLLSLLTSRASTEWESSTPYVGEDYLESAVDPSFDTANHEARAAWLYGQLAPPVAAAEPEQAAETSDEAWLDDMYDEMEAVFYRD